MKATWFIFLVLSGIAVGQESAFVARESSDVVVKDYDYVNVQNKATNACADVGTNVLYRVVCTKVEHAAGWQALDPAKKAAAKLAAANERADMDAKMEKIVKTAFLVVLESENKQQKWFTDFKAAVANAGTLAQLKTSVAALPNMPTNSPAQLKEAVRAKYKAMQ